MPGQAVLHLRASEKNLDSAAHPPYNSAMKRKGIMQKRIALLFVALVFILAVIPAFYPVEDEAVGKACPFCKAYGQLFSAFNTFSPIDLALSGVRTSSPLVIFSALPHPLASSAEPRAPPA